MKKFDLLETLAIMEEIFGFWLWWGLVVVAVAITVLFFYVMIRDRRFSPRHYLWSQIAAPFGGVIAIAIVLWATDSSLGHIRTTTDMIVMLGVAALGATGAVIWAYVLQAFIARRNEKIN